MRVAVWVPERPDVVRDLLHARAARSRRLVPTAGGTFLLGPAPENMRVLLDSVKVATTGDRPAVGFAWTDQEAWLVVRSARKNVRLSITDRGVPGSATAQVASALGVPAEVVERAMRATTGLGLPRLTRFLHSADLSTEAQALEWVERAGTAFVPVHPERPWERLVGEPRQPRNPRLQSFRPQDGLARSVLVGLLCVGALAATPLLYQVIASGLPAWLAIATATLAVLASVLCLSTLVLMNVRWRRPDPFPFSDPLGLMSDTPAH